MDLKHVGWESVGWINLVHRMNKRRTNIVIQYEVNSLQIPVTLQSLHSDSIGVTMPSAGIHTKLNTVYIKINCIYGIHSS